MPVCAGAASSRGTCTCASCGLPLGYEALYFCSTFAALPGLVSKHWLADEKNNIYGGVYIWETREAYDAFVNSELFAGVGSNPALVNISSTNFDVIEAPSRVTRGWC